MRPRSAICASVSPECTGPITGFIIPPGSPGSPIRLVRLRPTVTDGSFWPATRRTFIRRWVDRAQHWRPGCGESRMETQVISRRHRNSLLDTYHGERHPSLLACCARRWRRSRSCARTTGSRLAPLSMDEPRRRFGALMSGLDIHYDMGQGHPLLGRRMPDLDLVTAGGLVRAFALLHNARAVLLNIGRPGSLTIAPWRDCVQVVDAAYAGKWELPVLGLVPAPAAVLVHPEGYVGWVGEQRTKPAGAHGRAHQVVWFARRRLANGYGWRAASARAHA